MVLSGLDDYIPMLPAEADDFIPDANGRRVMGTGEEIGLSSQRTRCLNNSTSAPSAMKAKARKAR